MAKEAKSMNEKDVEKGEDMSENDEVQSKKQTLILILACKCCFGALVLTILALKKLSL